MLRATLPLLRSPRERLVAEHLLDVCGALPASRRLKVLQPEVEVNELRLKYGPGGEGERHRLLKEYLHRHPEMLRNGAAARAQMEFRFKTADRVDLAVEHLEGSWTVVEVEVEVEGTEGTLIGAHQVLKYRALLGGYLDEPTAIRGVLAAYSVPELVQEFCARHDIQVVEIDESTVSR